ncbi:MAG: dihydrofolate reductase [Erysipelotrichaceae bacterium]|nr:dihydrofolate reductase [Erysipelotrichaceae bacterium]
MSISIIAAIGQNRELGINNQLIWNIPSDLKFFRKITSGHTVIMGRKTFESIGKVLPKRRNIVITRNKNLQIEGVEIFNDINQALDFCKEDVFIIGGQMIYTQLIDIVDKLYLTEIEETCNADAYFPYFNKNNWNKKILSSNFENNIFYTHVLYTRK